MFNPNPNDISRIFDKASIVTSGDDNKIYNLYDIMKFNHLNTLNLLIEQDVPMRSLFDMAVFAANDELLYTIISNPKFKCRSDSYSMYRDLVQVMYYKRNKSFECLLKACRSKLERNHQWLLATEALELEDLGAFIAVINAIIDNEQDGNLIDAHPFMLAIRESLEKIKQCRN